MTNDKIKMSCGIAGVVFMGLGFILKFADMVYSFLLYDRAGVLYGLVPLFVFATTVVAFAFGIVSLVRKGDKAIVSEIIIAASFFSSFFFMNKYMSFFAAVFITIAAILYSIYFASVALVQQAENKELQQKNIVPDTFEEKVKKLVNYKQMLDEGLLSEEEFAAVKKNLLGE